MILISRNISKDWFSLVNTWPVSMALVRRVLLLDRSTNHVGGYDREISCLSGLSFSWSRSEIVRRQNSDWHRHRHLFILFSDASQYLVELASSVPSASLTSWLDQLIDLLTKRNRIALGHASASTAESVISFSDVIDRRQNTGRLCCSRIACSTLQWLTVRTFAPSHSSLSQCCFRSIRSSEALFSVLNAFSIPKFVYSRPMKKFIR